MVGMFVFGTHLGGLNTNCLAYSPDSQLLVSAKHGIKVWDFSTREELRELPTQGDASSVDFSPAGHIVVANGQRNAPVQIFDARTGDLVEEFPGSCKMQCAHFTDGGNTLVLAGHDHSTNAGYEKIYPIVRWSTKSRKKRRPLLGHSEEVGFLAFSHSGRMMASGNCQGEAILWDLKERKPLILMNHRAQNWRVVAFSDQDQFLAVTGGSTIELWDPKSLRRKRILRGHKGTVHSVKFTPTGQSLISISEDGTTKQWDPISGKEVCSFDWKLGPLNNLAISPDGLTAAAGSVQGQILVWDLDAA
jgi:WD40 repeat protein